MLCISHTLTRLTKFSGRVNSLWDQVKPDTATIAKYQTLFTQSCENEQNFFDLGLEGPAVPYQVIADNADYYLKPVSAPDNYVLTYDLKIAENTGNKYKVVGMLRSSARLLTLRCSGVPSRPRMDTRCSLERTRRSTLRWRNRSLFLGPSHIIGGSIRTMI